MLMDRQTESLPRHKAIQRRRVGQRFLCPMDVIVTLPIDWAIRQTSVLGDRSIYSSPRYGYSRGLSPDAPVHSALAMLGELFSCLKRPLHS